MSKLFTVLFVALLALSQCKLKKSKCLALGGDCDWIHPCCGDLKCRDYRCATADTKDNQLEFAPKGFKCDYFHHCSDNYECQSHRCILNPELLSKDLKKREAGKN